MAASKERKDGLFSREQGIIIFQNACRWVIHRIPSQMYRRSSVAVVGSEAFDMQGLFIILKCVICNYDFGIFGEDYQNYHLYPQAAQHMVLPLRLSRLLRSEFTPVWLSASMNCTYFLPHFGHFTSGMHPVSLADTEQSAFAITSTESSCFCFCLS